MTYNSQKDVTTTAGLICQSIATDCQKLGKCWEKCNHVLASLLYSFHKYLLLASIRNKTHGPLVTPSRRHSCVRCLQSGWR